MKVVYVTMAGDLFHRGHLELLRQAKELGDILIVGLHPDDVLASYKRQPVIPYEDRKAILKANRFVDVVVEDCMYLRSPTMFENIEKFQVTTLAHGDDWIPPLYEDAVKRKPCLDVRWLKATPNISTTGLINFIKSHVQAKPSPFKNTVVVSAGDAVTAKLVEEAGFGGIWVSGFEACARLGLPDNGSITMGEMLGVVKPIVKATTLPVFVDVDTGYGGPHNFARAVKAFEEIGCAGLSVEDNLPYKQNSLFGGKQPLAPGKAHGDKIKAGVATKRSPYFKIIARTEALIRGYGLNVAIHRINHYVSCGADMVLIHSREETGKEALSIPNYCKLPVPMVIVPTKFPGLTNSVLFKAGYSMIVWANQTERVKIKAIRTALKQLQEDDCATSIECSLSATLEDMKALMPEDNVV